MQSKNVTTCYQNQDISNFSKFLFEISCKFKSSLFGFRIQFLQLQLNLIDSFRRRLVQLHNTNVDSISSTKILNAVNYINSVLKEWSESVVSERIKWENVLVFLRI